ncbi:protein OPI10 homolog [Asterias rubens]|uniref:protein OPI10 homolog n=1 Tax=Asterias rubens TaxID=7604 RepID=UPI0014554613|nr:protein OPI10 homolog [Asterias rubens]
MTMRLASTTSLSFYRDLGVRETPICSPSPTLNSQSDQLWFYPLHRYVQTDMQQIDDTHVLFNIFNAATINHIVVFLTGTGAFPEGMGGAIYFSWPSPEGEMVWMFLGFITNEKPSAIFKVVGLKKDVDFDQLLRVLHEDVGELLQLRLVVRNQPVADDTPAKCQLDPHDGPR